jgi:PAS domain-containing protein
VKGVILIEPGQRIVWGNEAALAMHGVESLEDLSATVDAYRRRFRLRYRNNHILKKSDYPLARVIAGETFSDVTVEVCAAGGDHRWVHSIRSQVVTDSDGQPDCLVLVITDVGAVAICVGIEFGAISSMTRLPDHAARSTV